MRKIIFLGTPDFAIPSLSKLQDKFKIELVITQPDRRRARGSKTHPSPIKEYALKHDMKVFQPEDINSKASKNTLESYDVDFFVVVAYGQILSQDILEMPKIATVNLHASLLPKYRGGAPIHRAILDGMTKTGVSVMLVEPALDTGPILMQEELAIQEEDTTGDLHDVLAEKGAVLLLKSLVDFEKINPRVQSNKDSSYAKLISKKDRIIDWSKSATDVHNKVRALYPWPLAYTSFNNRRLIVTKTRIVKNKRGEVGEVIELLADGPLIKTACDDAVVLLEVKPQGKATMSGDDFLRGYQLKDGDVLK